MVEWYYEVPYVRKALLGLWKDYHSKKPSAEAKEAAKDGALDKSIPMAASSVEEAIFRVEAMHPGCVAIQSHARKLHKKESD